MANINLNNRGHKFILNGAEYLVSATIGGNLIEKTITENGEYDASDDNIQGEQTFVNHTALSKNAWTSIDLPEEYLGYISSDEFRMRIETLTTPINTTFEFSEIAVYTPNMSYEDATLIDEREQLSETTKLYCAITSDKSKFYFYVQANTFIPYTFHQATVTVNKEVNGYYQVNVDVAGGGSVDGLYFDGTTTNNLRIPYHPQDYEIEVKFFVPSYQNYKSIFGTTSNGIFPICFMYNNGSNNIFRVNNGSGGQIDYVPTRFDTEHTVILNRISDRAIIFDGDNIGTYGTSYFSDSDLFDLGNLVGAVSLQAAEFVLKEFKLTDHTTSEVLADYKAGFRALSNGYKIPCLLNTIDDTYIDLNTGRSSGNNNGHIMVCQNPDEE